MFATHVIGVPWLLPLSLFMGGIAWFIPIIAGLAASYLANRGKGGGNNTGQHTNVDPGVPPIGPKGGMIFEQGSPYWPGSQPQFPSNAFGQQGGGGGGGGGASSQSTSTTNYSSTTQPFILPEWLGVGNKVRSEVEGRLANPYSLPRGYQAAGLANINDAFDLTNQTIDNRLASSGLGGSPMAEAAMAGSGNVRAKAVAGFLNELPMQERQLRTEDLQLASSILEAFGKGQKTSGKSTTVSSGSSSGGGGGGGGPQTPMIGDAILGQYMNGQNKPAGVPWWQQALGYAATIAAIYSQFKGGGGGKTAPAGGGGSGAFGGGGW